MPSVNKTTNLGLNQWQGNEYPKRLDFVEDNSAIDIAVGKPSELVTIDKTNLVSAINEVKEQTNNLGKSSLVNLGYVTTGTCVAFIQGKIAEGYKTGLFVATALLDMPEGGLVLYYSSTNVTGSVTVELHSQTTDYLARINNSTGAYIINWKKLATDYVASSLATVEKMPSEYTVGMTMEYTGDRAIDGITWVELLTYRGSTAGEAIQYAFTYRYGTTKDILRYRTSANSAGSSWGAWQHVATVEEGTWTPKFIGQTTAGTNTYSTQVGKYYKVGKLVHLEFKLQLSVKDSAMAGSLQLVGLPFALPSDGVSGVSIGQYGYFDFPTGYTALNAMLYPGSSVVYFYLGGDNVMLSTVNVSQISANSYVYGSIDYMTN